MPRRPALVPCYIGQIRSMSVQPSHCVLLVLVVELHRHALHHPSIPPLLQGGIVESGALRHGSVANWRLIPSATAS